MEPLISPFMVLIVSLLFLFKDSFGSKEYTKNYIPLNTESKLNKTKPNQFK